MFYVKQYLNTFCQSGKRDVFIFTFVINDLTSGNFCVCMLMKFCCDVKYGWIVRNEFSYLFILCVHLEEQCYRDLFIAGLHHTEEI